MPSGPQPPHGLAVTVYSGQHPPHGSPAPEGSAATNPPHKAQRSRSDSSDEAQLFTRADIVSVRLLRVRPRPFSVVVSTRAPGTILIESVEVSICDEDEPVFNIPVSDSSVVLNKRRDSQVFRLRAQQIAAISEHLERGRTVTVRVRYLAADESELKISIIEKESHHKIPYVLAIIALGFGVQSVLKFSPTRNRSAR